MIVRFGVLAAGFRVIKALFSPRLHRATPLTGTLLAWFCLPAMLLLASCGILEVGVESTQTLPATIPASPTSQVPERPSATPPVATPTLVPTPTVSADPPSGKIYENQVFRVSLTYPESWTAVPGYSTDGDKFTGPDGFFILTAAGGGTIDMIAGSEAEHRLRPYGSRPTIEIAQIQGQPARFIWPSDDANMDDQAALIVQMLQPVNIHGNPYDYVVLYADIDHLRSLAQSLRFLVDASQTEAREGFWEELAEDPGEMIIPFLLRSEVRNGLYGDIATMRADGRDLTQLTQYLYNADPVLSPDGQRIAYRSVPITITSLPDPGARLRLDYYNIWVITMDGRRAWQLSQSEAVRSIPTWSADSRRVAFSQGETGQLVVVEIENQFQRVVTEGAFAPRYRPGSEDIAFITSDGSLAWIQPEGDIHTIVDAAGLGANSFVNDFDWSPDGQHLVYTVADETERRVPDLNVGVEYRTWITPADRPEPVWLADDLHDVSMSPDGRFLTAFQGSGFADACMVDSRLRFLRLAEDLTVSEASDLDTFAEFPQISSNQSFYPRGNVTWVSDHLVHGEFGITCTTDNAAEGAYLMDPARQRMVRIGEGS